jgi:hypothetical protein
MTSPHRLPSVVATGGWKVDIDMPLGRNWKPVGWLTTNNSRTIHWSKHARIAAAWRRAAYNAYLSGVPAGLGRVRFACQLVFTDRTRRDLANFEPTIKAIVDALQPQRQYHRKKKDGSTELVIEVGVGAIPDDTAEFLERAPEMPVGEPLGRTSPVKGRVVVFITQLPPDGGQH